MRYLSFLVDNDRFAVDVSLVREYARKMMVTPVPSAPDSVVGIANMKGRVITILSLYELLGRGESGDEQYIDDTINAIVFKPFSSGEDQMGLKIDKPLGLIDIDDDAIRHQSLMTETEESFCISGITEIGDCLYRIIDFNSIIEVYKDDGEQSADSDENGGTEDEQ